MQKIRRVKDVQKIRRLFLQLDCYFRKFVEDKVSQQGLVAGNQRRLDLVTRALLQEIREED